MHYDVITLFVRQQHNFCHRWPTYSDDDKGDERDNDGDNGHTDYNNMMTTMVMVMRRMKLNIVTILKMVMKQKRMIVMKKNTIKLFTQRNNDDNGGDDDQEQEYLMSSHFLCCNFCHRLQEWGHAPTVVMMVITLRIVIMMPIIGIVMTMMTMMIYI